MRLIIRYVVFVKRTHKTFTKTHGFGIVDLDDGWKLFYSGSDPSMSANAGVRILISPQFSVVKLCV